MATDTQLDPAALAAAIRVSSRPEFITFTGADDKTGIQDLQRLSDSYPMVEFGILMSPTRSGLQRYPSQAWIDEVTSAGLRLSAHVCGGYSRRIVENLAAGRGRDDVDLGGFMRMQLNTTSVVDPAALREWARHRRVRPILQCRGGFPEDGNVFYLFDRSGGRGALPSSWPTPTGTRLVGYAGGLGPDNVAAQLGHFREPYWIDMESRVRNGRDEFDVTLCRRVCETVYAAREAAGGKRERET